MAGKKAKSVAEQFKDAKARVEKLKMMVEAGTYKVDLDTLASRIVDDEAVRGSRR